MKHLLLLFILIPFLNFSQVQIGEDIDGEIAYRHLGTSVDLSSNGSIVAASGSFTSGWTNSLVRVYQNDDDEWTQIGQDIIGTRSFTFNSSYVKLSADGSIVAISDYGYGDNYENTGRVMVYENQGGTWTQIGQDIDAVNYTSNSNNYVRLLNITSDGNSVAVIETTENEFSSEAILYEIRFYENEEGVWVDTNEHLEITTLQTTYYLNCAVSKDNSTIVVRTPENGNHKFSIYKNQDNNWVQIAEEILAPSFTGALLSADGSSVAIYDRNNSNCNVYEINNGELTQTGNTISLTSNYWRPGSFTLNGSVIAFSSYEYNNNTGQVRIYKNINGVWTQVGEDINGEYPGDQLGNIGTNGVSLSSDGSIVAIGSRDNHENGTDSGHVRVYSIASELGLLEVIEDIAGNSNGINVSSEQLNAIEGVSGAIDGVNYTTALQNGTYADSDNPTALEIQAIIDLVNASLSIDDDEKLNFSIYPNPAKDQFTLQLDNLSELQNVTIYNNLGQLVFTTKETIIDTSKLASGLYLVKVETTKGKGTKKLIIE